MSTFKQAPRALASISTLELIFLVGGCRPNGSDCGGGARGRRCWTGG